MKTFFYYTKQLLMWVFLAFAVVCTLPSLFPRLPAIQVINKSLQNFSERDLKAIEQSLAPLGLEYSYFLDETREKLNLNFQNTEDRKSAKEKLETSFSGRFVAAYKKIVDVPEWLRGIADLALTLGLDLQGGVQFIYEIDQREVYKNKLEYYKQTIVDHWQQKSVNLRKIEVFADVENEDFKLLLSGVDQQELNEIKQQVFLQLDVATQMRSDGKAELSFDSEVFLLDMEQSVEQNITTIRNRVNELGIAEPSVNRFGEARIIVQLPGVEDPAEAKNIIGQTANLEYRMESRTANPYTARKFQFKENPAQTAWLENKIIITGSEVVNAQAGFDQQSNEVVVHITLNAEGGRKMLANTGKNIGRLMGVVMYETYNTIEYKELADGSIEKTLVPQKDEGIISLATIAGTFGPQFQTSGFSSFKEANQLALLLRSGSLSAPIQVVDEKSIGPSVGEENILKGMYALSFALFWVLVVMVVVYKQFGLFANAALIVNLILVLAAMSALGATLTLPGIGGLVLTVGMAIDANIIINSRIQEFLREGAKKGEAIKKGFQSAFDSILDSNLTTLFIGIIMFALASGPVRGFAVTLCLGIVTSFFSAIFFSRSLMGYFYPSSREVDEPPAAPSRPSFLDGAG